MQKESLRGAATQGGLRGGKWHGAVVDVCQGNEIGVLSCVKN